MAVYLCRWQNGDISVVAARNKNEAIEKLDEIANADKAEVFRLRDFLVNFRLTNRGTLSLDYWIMGAESWASAMGSSTRS
jgi:hypothetical protein